MDAAGVVDEVGDGVSDVATGDAVLGIGLATYAEYAVLHLAGDGLIPDLIELTGEPGRVLTLADYRAGQYGALLSQRPVNPAAALADAAALFTGGALGIPVQEAFTLETAARAHEGSQAGHVVGRFVIAVD